ncbi:hypothetical protein FACS1894166_09940 [Bacilli bacterium]|nr:hypothetical protein FACS1894166_09940 [Bacilli bacterium]
MEQYKLLLNNNSNNDEIQRVWAVAYNDRDLRSKLLTLDTDDELLISVTDGEMQLYDLDDGVIGDITKITVFDDGFALNVDAEIKGENLNLEYLKGLNF